MSESSIHVNVQMNNVALVSDKPTLEFYVTVSSWLLDNVKVLGPVWTDISTKNLNQL